MLPSICLSEKEAKPANGMSQLLLTSRSFSGVWRNGINSTCWKVTMTGMGGLNDPFKWEYKCLLHARASPLVLLVYHFTAVLTCKVQVLLQQWVCVHVPVTVCICWREPLSLSRSLSRSTPVSLSTCLCLSFLTLFPPLLSRTEAEQGATILLTKYFVKDPAMVTQTQTRLFPAS